MKWKKKKSLIIKLHCIQPTTTDYIKNCSASQIEETKKRMPMAVVSKTKIKEVQLHKFKSRDWFGLPETN